MLVYLSMLEDEGDRQAFADFYEENKDLSLKVAMRFLNDQMQAENASHDAFCSAATHFKKILGMPCQERVAYFVTIVKNKCRDILRAEKRYRKMVRFDSEEELESLHIKRPPQESGEVSEMVAEVIQMLPERYQAVMENRLIQKLSNKQTAKVLGISEDLASKRFERGRKKIIELLQEGGYRQ